MRETKTETTAPPPSLKWSHWDEIFVHLLHTRRTFLSVRVFPKYKFMRYLIASLYLVDRVSSARNLGSLSVGRRGRVNLGEVLDTLAVNFLLYVVLIIVFYMLVRFYLEDGYVEPQKVEILNENALDNEDQDETEDEPLIHLEISSNKTPAENITSIPYITCLELVSSNDWKIQEGTKQEVMQRAIFCALGLIGTFCVWGLLQERMVTYPYDGEYFVYSYGLVFFTRLGGLCLSAFLMLRMNIKWVPCRGALYEYSYPSVANMLSSWCQYEALKYVSFPTQVLAKALKLVPVMLMGKYLMGKSYETYEYVTASTIGLGIYLFISSSEHLELDKDAIGNPDGTRGPICGVVLLIMFLFFDSFTGQTQNKMFQRNPQLSPLQMMLIINAFSCAFSLITLVHQEELQSTLLFVYAHPTMSIHLTLYCICSVIGQLFIFYTVKNFGAVVFSVIMSLRILFSILLSCLVFKHPIKELGVLGIMIVFGAITYRTKKKADDEPLFKWTDRHINGKKIFHAWHEHVDI